MFSSTQFKSIFAAGGAAISYLYGGWPALLQVLLAFVVIDYLTGIISAALEGKLASAVGARGIAKKVLIFVLVACAHLVDTALGENHIIRDATIFFYLGNELLSIIENAGEIGLPIPPAISNAVQVLREKSELK